jgi:hypothetical protein
MKFTTMGRILSRCMVHDPFSMIMAGAGGLQAGAGLAGSAMQAGAATDAARIAAGAADRATQMQWDMFLKQQENQQPWLQAGKGALNQLTGGLGINPGGYAVTAAPGYGATPQQIMQMVNGTLPNPNGYTIADAVKAANASNSLIGSGGAPATGGANFLTTPQFAFDTSRYKFDPNSVDVTKDPGYAFRLKSGANALTAAGSAAGNLGSGNLGVALTNYGQDLGSQEYGAAYGRAFGENQLNFTRDYTSALDMYNAAMTGQNTVFNRLAGVAGVGQTAANTLTSAGLQTAGQIGQNAIGAGNAAAAGRTGAANAWAGGIAGVGNQIMGGFGAYNQNQLYQQYLANMGGGAGRAGGYGGTTDYQLAVPEIGNSLGWG